MEKIYDLIIVGAGPAGLSASLYASRYKLEHLLFGAQEGGQMAEIFQIENWPGDISVSGKELIDRFRVQVESYGVEIKKESVSSISAKKEKAGQIFEVETSGGNYFSRTMILAMGAEYRKINIPGEKEFTGRGVSYCATCDAMFFKNKKVCVIGGGNSAAVVALELSGFCSKIYLTYRSLEMKAEPAWLEKIEKDSKIIQIPETNVLEIQGGLKVEKILLDKPFDGSNILSVDGVFVEVGSEPGVSLAKKMGVELDQAGYIKVFSNQATNIAGIFAAGDITTGSNKFRQIITASAEGAVASAGAYKFLKLGK